jgi:hypothetical protein
VKAKIKKQGPKLHLNALFAFNIIEQKQGHESRVTPSYLVDEWLSWVHLAIGNLKRFC